MAQCDPLPWWRYDRPVLPHCQHGAGCFIDDLNNHIIHMAQCDPLPWWRYDRITTRELSLMCSLLESADQLIQKQRDSVL